MVDRFHEIRFLSPAIWEAAAKAASYSHTDRDAACLNARKAAEGIARFYLEAVCLEPIHQRSDLLVMMEHLERLGKLNSETKSRFNALRRLGNNSAHIGGRKHSDIQVEKALDDIDFLFGWLQDDLSREKFKVDPRRRNCFEVGLYRLTDLRIVALFATVLDIREALENRGVDLYDNVVIASFKDDLYDILVLEDEHGYKIVLTNPIAQQQLRGWTTHMVRVLNKFDLASRRGSKDGSASNKESSVSNWVHDPENENCYNCNPFAQDQYGDRLPVRLNILGFRYWVGNSLRKLSIPR